MQTFSAWEKVKWGLNIGGEKALNAILGFSDTWVNWIRKLHVHYGPTKSQMKKHRALIDLLKKLW